MVVEPIFAFLLDYEPVIAVTIYSVFVLVLINIFYKILVKQNDAKELKAKTKETSKRMRELQKEGKTDEATKLMSEMMQQNSKLMRLTMKPMIVSLIIVVILLPFLHSGYADTTVAIKDGAGNFTLGGNAYTVAKDGSEITISGASSIVCQPGCVEQIDGKWYELHEENGNVKLARIVALLPFTLPFFGNNFGWLGWYILVSIPVVVLIRKIMKIYV